MSYDFMRAHGVASEKQATLSSRGFKQVKIVTAVAESRVRSMI